MERGTESRDTGQTSRPVGGGWLETQGWDLRTGGKAGAGAGGTEPGRWQEPQGCPGSGMRRSTTSPPSPRAQGSRADPLLGGPSHLPPTGVTVSVPPTKPASPRPCRPPWPHCFQNQGQAPRCVLGPFSHPGLCGSHSPDADLRILARGPVPLEARFQGGCDPSFPLVPGLLCVLSPPCFCPDGSTGEQPGQAALSPRTVFRLPSSSELASVVPAGSLSWPQPAGPAQTQTHPAERARLRPTAGGAPREDLLTEA